MSNNKMLNFNQTKAHASIQVIDTHTPAVVGTVGKEHMEKRWKGFENMSDKDKNVTILPPTRKSITERVKKVVILFIKIILVLLENTESLSEVYQRAETNLQWQWPWCWFTQLFVRRSYGAATPHPKPNRMN